MTVRDAEAIFRIRGDYEVVKHNTGKAYISIDQAKALIEIIAEKYEEQKEIRWGITLKPDQTVIGMCGYNYWHREDFRASVGYDLARAHWGKGIMSEALGAVVRFGFEHMNLNRVEADVSAENPASVRVLEKMGFQLEGRQRQQYFQDAAFHDLLMYGLLRGEFL